MTDKAREVSMFAKIIGGTLGYIIGFAWALIKRPSMLIGYYLGGYGILIMQGWVEAPPLNSTAIGLMAAGVAFIAYSEARDKSHDD